MIVQSGLDIASRELAHPVSVGGETVYFGGITHRQLKQTLQEHDVSILPYQNRLEIYQETHQDVTWPAFKNLLAGFGSGSKLQGDISGELFGMVSDWTTLSIVGVGFGIMAAEYFFTYPLFYDIDEPYRYGSAYPLSDVSLTMMIAGGGAFVLGRIIQALIPVSYGLRYNRTLRNGLGITKEMTDSWSVGMALRHMTDEHMSPMGRISYTASVEISLR